MVWKGEENRFEKRLISCKIQSTLWTSNSDYGVTISTPTITFVRAS